MPDQIVEDYAQFAYRNLPDASPFEQLNERENYQTNVEHTWQHVGWGYETNQLSFAVGECSRIKLGQK